MTAPDDMPDTVEPVHAGPGMPRDLASERRQEDRPLLAPVPPPLTLANADAERWILGAAIVEPEHLDRLATMLTPSAFYYAPHAAAWRAIMAIHTRAAPLTYPLLLAELSTLDLTEVVTADLLEEILDSYLPGAPALLAHANLVRELAERRAALAAVDAARLAIVDRRKPIGPILGSVVDGIVRATPHDPHATETLGGSIQAAMDEIDLQWKLGSGLIGHSSGLDDLDGVTHGFQDGELWVVAARPSMGKTAIAVNIARFGALEADLGVLFFSLEMARKKIVRRILTAEAGVDALALIGQGDAEQGRAWSAMTKAAERLHGATIEIDDTKELNAAQMRFRVDAYTRQRGAPPSIVLIDYLSLMGDREAAYDRHDIRIGARVKDVRNLLCPLGFPVLLLHQLSREHTKGEEPRAPRLSDLKDSGEIEQHADGVLFLHPTGAGGSHAEDGRVLAIVAKHRDGPTGTCNLRFNRTTGRFSSWSHRHRTRGAGEDLR
jgi:replicative DNA helicase